MVTRRIRATVCNVPPNLPIEVVASFLSTYVRVEEMAQLHSTAGTAHEDNALRLCLDREGFQTIPYTQYILGRQMMVVVEDRRLCCWNCKQIGNLANVCLQKAADIIQQPKEAEDSTFKAIPEVGNTNTDTE